MSLPNTLTYKDAGVDIDAGNALVEAIKPEAASTTRPGVMDGLGGFGAMFDLKSAGYEDPILVAATDGVGTKLKLAIDTGRFDTVGIDLVAMCVNDLVCQGAEPLFFLDYFATGALDVDQGTAIVQGVADGCRQAGCALIGGETAEMPGLYAKGDFDMAGFAVGAMERGANLPGPVAESDVLIGLTSSGVHSNGYSLVRKIVETAGVSWADENEFWEVSYGEAFLAPTRIYVKPALAAVKAGATALAHITGGGVTENLPRALPDNLGAAIDLTAFPDGRIFRWLAEHGGVSDEEMLKTFNCGIGMIAVASPDAAQDVLDALAEAGQTAYRIGVVTPVPGVVYIGSLT